MIMTLVAACGDVMRVTSCGGCIKGRINTEQRDVEVTRGLPNHPRTPTSYRAYPQGALAAIISKLLGVVPKRGELCDVFHVRESHFDTNSPSWKSGASPPPWNRPSLRSGLNDVMRISAISDHPYLLVMVLSHFPLTPPPPTLVMFLPSPNPCNSYLKYSKFRRLRRRFSSFPTLGV